ncbi:MAG: hypothetical protein R3F30_15155 [Planctomycetota bacterium]
MRLLLELLPWLLLLALPGFVAMAGPAEPEPLEARFVDQAVLPLIEAPPDQQPAVGLGELWFALFHSSAGGLGQRLGVGIAWLLAALCLALGVVAAHGGQTAALALLGLALHPLMRGFGGARLPWLPAMTLVLAALTFLVTMALPTYAQRPRSPGRWGPRVLSILGAGMALGLASSADPTMAWVMLLPGMLLLEALLLALAGMWRARGRRWRRHRQPVDFLWPTLWRTLPWVLGWFGMMILLVAIYGAIGKTDTERLFGLVHPLPTARRSGCLPGCPCPGLLLLAARRGQRASIPAQHRRSRQCRCSACSCSAGPSALTRP